MLDWLKEILGEGWTEEADKKVSDKIGKGFVARSGLNTKNEEQGAEGSQGAEQEKKTLEPLRFKGLSLGGEGGI